MDLSGIHLAVFSDSCFEAIRLTTSEVSNQIPIFFTNQILTNLLFIRIDYLTEYIFMYEKISLKKVSVVKFIYSERATKFCEIFTLLLTGTTQDKSKVKISQNFVAFSEYMNFTSNFCPLLIQVLFTSDNLFFGG